VKAVGKPVAGKTGTTNESRDVWFMGFSPDLVAGVYLGFDQPRSLGKKATGGRYAAPIFRDFMMEALKDKPATPFRVPPGIRLVRVDYHTGQRPVPGGGKVILEAFKPGTEPTGQQNIIQGIANYGQDAGYGSIIPLGNGDQGQGGTTIINSTGTTFGQVPGAPNTANAGPGVVTGEPTDDQPNVLPPGITPREEDQALQPIEPPLQGPAAETAQDPNQNSAQNPAQNPAKAPALGEAPTPPVQPAVPSAPATDSSGGIY
jgi:penicillin-binding protein 1A